MLRENLCAVFSSWPDTNQNVKPQKIARLTEFPIIEESRIIASALKRTQRFLIRGGLLLLST